jgi:hypothetical protein
LKTDHHGEWRVFLMNEYPCPQGPQASEISFSTKDFAKACEVLGLNKDEQ